MGGARDYLEEVGNILRSVYVSRGVIRILLNIFFFGTLPAQNIYPNDANGPSCNFSKFNLCLIGSLVDRIAWPEISYDSREILPY